MTGTAAGSPRPGPPQPPAEAGIHRAAAPLPRYRGRLRGAARRRRPCVALVWANSPFGRQLRAALGDRGGASVRRRTELTMDLRHWVDDGLMALFFLVVGLEVTREITVGELRDRAHGGVPVLAALGGMVAAGADLLRVQRRRPRRARLGHRDGDRHRLRPRRAGAARPARARISSGCSCSTVAIVDDIGAILVIAVFYSDDISSCRLLVAAAALVGRAGRACVGSVSGEARPTWRSGLALWLAVLRVRGARDHRRGVDRAVGRPTRAPAPPAEIDGHTRGRSPRTRRPRSRPGSPASPRRRPSHRTNGSQYALHPWTSYLIVPLFALANAGVAAGR